MRRLTAWIYRAIAWHQMRSIEINLAGALDALPYVTDELTREAMALAIKRMSIDLCAARSRYQAFLPPGERHVWRIA